MASTTGLGIPSWQDRALSVERDWVITAGVVAILLGVFVIFRPRVGIATLALVFGIYLLAAGVWRLARSVTDPGKSTGRRVLGVILGIVIAAAGIFCLFFLQQSVVLLGVTLGIGIIVVGIADLFRNNAENDSTPTWVRVISGILALIVGALMCIVPFISVGVVVFFGAIVLIAVGVGGLFTLPRKETHELRS
jgi:uncharacterized membrane protein HdeD (DUF308 family)